MIDNKEVVTDNIMVETETMTTDNKELHTKVDKTTWEEDINRTWVAIKEDQDHMVCNKETNNSHSQWVNPQCQVLEVCQECQTLEVCQECHKLLNK